MMSCFRKRGRLFVAAFCLSLAAHANTASGQSAVYEIDTSYIAMENNVMCIGRRASELLLTNVRDLMVNSSLSLSDALTAIRPRLIPVSVDGDIDCYIFELRYVPIYPLAIIDTVEFGAGNWQGADRPHYLVKSVVTAFDGQMFNREILGDDVYTMANDLTVKKSPR